MEDMMADKNELMDSIIGNASNVTYRTFVSLNGYEEYYGIHFDVSKQSNTVTALLQIAEVSFINVSQAFSNFDSDDVFIDVYVDVDDDMKSAHLVISTSLGKLVDDLWSLDLGRLDHNLDYLSMKMRNALRDESEII
jgi:hypothetical protein